MPGTELSVVIASCNASSTIASCLEALEEQHERERLEVIVADSSSDGTDEIVRQRFPWVRLLHFDTPLSIARLRGRGLLQARSEIVAVIDPYSIVQENWLPELLRVHRERPNPVIGGSVELDEADRQNLTAWTLFISEYGMFMPPVKAGPASNLPGSNISYKRSVLKDEERFGREGFWKTFVNRELASQEPLWLEPSVAVRLRKPIPFWSFLRTRYDHGRCFAGMRVADKRWPERLLRAVSTPLVPAVLWLRWLAAYWPKGRYRFQFVATTPGQWLLFAAWAWGELWGYLFGRGGTCDRLYY
jgi:glycosyltransferase involved in cell wall biosynthesis